jgi:hypothetical protein
MKPDQPAARLLGGHLAGNLGPNQPKTALSIEPVRRFLDLGRGQDHLCKPPATRFFHREAEHALRNA